MTKREMFTMIKAEMSANAEVVAFCENEIALLDKRKESKSNTPTKAQREAEALKPTVFEAIANGGVPMTCSDVAKALGGTYSTQKLTPIISKLIDDKQVICTVVKGRSYYTVA